MTGTYTVIGMNECFEASDTFNLTVYASPLIELGEDITIFDDESFTLNENGLTNLSYVWNPGTGLDDPYAISPVASPSSTTDYNVVVTDEFGCEKSDQITIIVVERPLPDIEIYNTFTPNGDGVNDTWYIENIEAYVNCTLEIYNRNGNEIYRAINYQNDWDGKYKNKDCPAATYIYILDLGVPNEELRKGTVTIIR
jgi:gliding motility-associated-like protein